MEQIMKFGANKEEVVETDGEGTTVPVSSGRSRSSGEVQQKTETDSPSELTTSEEGQLFDIEIHECALLIPEMSNQEFVSLKQDIERNGLIDPIVLTEDGRLLDGRHRYRACRELGIEPKLTTYDGDTPFQYVLSKNIQRRHLDKGQRAAIAVEMLPFLEKEAEQRRLANLRQGNEIPERAKLPHREAGRSRDIAAARMAELGQPVSSRAIQNAKMLKEKHPDIYEKMGKGEWCMSNALKTAKARERVDFREIPFDRSQRLLWGELAGDRCVQVGKNFTDKSDKEINAWLGCPEVGFLFELVRDGENPQKLILRISETRGGKSKFAEQHWKTLEEYTIQLQKEW